jgi:hypothetical protein
MTEDELLKSVLDFQAPTGAFPSVISSGNRKCQDWNGFTTAQVLRALRAVPESDPLSNARRLALDFLKSCESPDRSGAFHFWPKGSQPSWIPDLPPDADDTSIILVEMVRNKRIDLDAAREMACSVLLPYRLMNVPDPRPPWVRRGTFLTWLRPGPFNIVDCCVNANVIALLSYLGLEGITGFEEACEMIGAGIRWAEGSDFKARILTAFYPHPAEFAYAIEHAVECGANRLRGSLSLTKDLGWLPHNDDNHSEGMPICGNAYEGDIWFSEALDAARKFGKRFTNPARAE